MTQRTQEGQKYQKKLNQMGLKRSSLLWTDKVASALQAIADEIDVPRQEVLMHINLKELIFHKQTNSPPTLDSI